MKIGCTPFDRACRPSGGLLFGLFLLLALPVALTAQATPPLTGVVVDAVTRRPVEGVLVAGPNPESRVLTDASGEFTVELPAGPQPVVFTAFGYQRTEREFDPVTAGSPVRVELTPLPPQLEGVDVTVRSFQARLDSITTWLDYSAHGDRWTGRGTPRIATREDLAKYDDVGDSELALAALDISLALDFECGWRFNGRNRHPRVILVDGELEPILGCQILRDLDISSICRIELIPWAPPLKADIPVGLDGQNDLYIWTCAYLARVAAGTESIPRLLQIPPSLWGHEG